LVSPSSGVRIDTILKVAQSWKTLSAKRRIKKVEDELFDGQVEFTKNNLKKHFSSKKKLVKIPKIGRLKIFSIRQIIVISRK